MVEYAIGGAIVVTILMAAFQAMTGGVARVFQGILAHLPMS